MKSLTLANGKEIIFFSFLKVLLQYSLFTTGEDNLKGVTEQFLCEENAIRDTF